MAFLEEIVSTEQNTNAEAGKEHVQKIEERLEQARDIVKRSMLWAAGIGVIPIPIVDLLGITGVQVKMLKNLSDLYEIPFLEHKVKNTLGSLLSGLGSVGLGGAVVLSLAKAIPGLGHLAGAVAIPVAAGGLTYATGRVFIQHFESGGTFLDLDPRAVREHFRQEFQRGKQLVEEMQSAKKAAD
jgi:uncharacterized protein (DUF697 family)